MQIGAVQNTSWHSAGLSTAYIVADAPDQQLDIASASHPGERSTHRTFSRPYPHKHGKQPLVLTQINPARENGEFRPGSCLFSACAPTSANPEQTIKRLTQRLGRAPTPEEIKAERDMLMRAAYSSMLLAEISFADEVLRKQDGNCTILSPVKFMGAPKRHLGPIEED